MFVRRKIRREAPPGGAWDFVLVKSVRDGKKVRQEFVAHLARWRNGSNVEELGRRVRLFDSVQYRLEKLKFSKKDSGKLIQQIEHWIIRPTDAECRVFWKTFKAFGAVQLTKK